MVSEDSLRAEEHEDDESDGEHWHSEESTVDLPLKGGDQHEQFRHDESNNCADSYGAEISC